ncbi:hypothetical protein N9V74_00725 [Alteromonas sp.]|nr:hypothetical protein [Alteromonas sp.]
MDEIISIEKSLNWTDDFSKKKPKNSDIKSFSLSIIFHTLLAIIALLGFNSLPPNVTEKPSSPIKAILYVPVTQRETNTETLLSPQNVFKIALPTKRPIEQTDHKIMESPQIPVTSSENISNVDSSLIIQPKIEPNVQFDSLKGELDIKFSLEVDTKMPSNDQEIRVDIFATKANKDLGAFNRQAFETLMHHDIRAIQKLKISPDLDIPARTYRDDEHERMENLAITVDCNSIRGGTLTLVSQLLNGTLGKNQNYESASAHKSVASVDRIRCSKIDIDRFIQRRMNKVKD